jgi:hypothetical protein
MRKLKEIDINKIDMSKMTPAKFKRLNERFEKLIEQENRRIEAEFLGEDVTLKKIKEFDRAERQGLGNFKRTYNCPCGSKKTHQDCCYKPFYK